MTQSNFDQAARWVCQHQNTASRAFVSETEIASTFAALHEIAEKCRAAVMIPDLFPGSLLEAIYIPANTDSSITPNSVEKFAGDARVTQAALTTIGAALVAGLGVAGHDMMNHEVGNGAQAIVYLPEVRDTVLQATGLVLLDD